MPFDSISAIRFSRRMFRISIFVGCDMVIFEVKLPLHCSSGKGDVKGKNKIQKRAMELADCICTMAGQQSYCAAGFSRSGIPAEGTSADLADDRVCLHCYGALFFADPG